MKFGRVIGTLVATQKCQGLEGVKFLVVQLLDRQLRPQGDPVIAADGTAQAGPGELVCVLGGREAALALPKKFVPVDHTVAAIIDIVDLWDEKALPPANVHWRRPPAEAGEAAAPTHDRAPRARHPSDAGETG